MNRREFVTLASSAAIAVTFDGPLFSKNADRSQTIDAAWYSRNRKFVELPGCRAAYVELGHGPTALFLHGLPLNGYQWRGALERLHTHRRCIAPDLMSMGYTVVHDGQEITPDSQVAMLSALLDKLRVKEVDLVANDSGGMVAQVFTTRYPDRVRSLLLTNCDVDQNNPPENFVPAVEMAKKKIFTRKFIQPQVQDKNLARTGNGMLGSAYTIPERLSDETLEIYLRPLVESERRMEQLDQYTVALGVNELVGLRDRLQGWQGRARMVWAAKDKFFPLEWAFWLDKNLAHSTGVKVLEDANLFFPEEMPDIVTAEARTLWGVK